MWIKRLCVAALMLMSVSEVHARARITRLEVLRTEPALGGEAFGDVGPYQHVFARAYGELDPADPRNAVIQDLYLALRDARGMVEYSTEVRRRLSAYWSGLMPLNVRFGQPVRAWGEQTDHLYPAYDFPFSHAR